MEGTPAQPTLDALTGPQAAFGSRRGRAVRFDPDVSPFAALPSDAGERDWADLAALAGPGATLVLVGNRVTPPRGWEVVRALDGVQMDGVAVATRADPHLVELGPGDRDAMGDLARRTEPGPWERRTAELGRFLGVRDGGRLVAMAGERMHGRGWTEISAVCTDPSARGRGHAERLVRAVAHGIRGRGDRPLLHAAAFNAPALRLYERLGFTLSRPMPFDLLRTPGRPTRGT